jgi:hypothetical protein
MGELTLNQVEVKNWAGKTKFRIMHFMKRLGQKMYLYNYKSTHKEEYIPRSDYEALAIQTCRNLITKNPDSDLRIAPISGRRHIKNKRLEIKVFIHETSIDIIKNHHPQNVPISVKGHKTILNMFDNYAEKYRDIEEEEDKADRKHSIESILEETRVNNI